jgi:putative oxidoreductase
MCMTKIAEKYGDGMYILARIIIGAMLAVHGAQKFGVGSDMTVAGFAGFAGVPVALGYVAALIELVGGMCIVLGLFTRYAADLAALVMIMAWVLVHAKGGNFNPFANGGELSAAYFAVLLIMMKLGNGKWSLEQAIFEKER